MRLPKGRTDKRTHLVNVTDQYRARHDPSHTQFQISPQTSLINEHTIERVLEVKLTKMKIPQSVTSGGATKSGLSFIKATQIEGLKHGQTIDFGITGDVEVSGGQPRPDGTPTNQLYSVPVKGRYGKTDLLGQYSLNKTALKILVDRLGDETEEWVGATFTSMALPTRNPQTNAQTTTLSILAESVKGAKSK